MNNFRRLDVWRHSTKLTQDLYGVTHNFPAEERYGLQQQMRRAVVSIPSNIAEGAVRRSDPDFRRFLFIARGSAAELETQLRLSRQFGYIDAASEQKLVADVDTCQAMLARLIESLS
ncbi:MAG: four helix bundle protein [Acidimicrobiia bacterium]